MRGWRRPGRRRAASASSGWLAETFFPRRPTRAGAHARASWLAPIVIVAELQVLANDGKFLETTRCHGRARPKAPLAKRAHDVACRFISRTQVGLGPAGHALAGLARVSAEVDEAELHRPLAVV